MGETVRETRVVYKRVLTVRVVQAYLGFVPGTPDEVKDAFDYNPNQFDEDLVNRGALIGEEAVEIGDQFDSWIETAEEVEA